MSRQVNKLTSRQVNSGVTCQLRANNSLTKTKQIMLKVKANEKLQKTGTHAGTYCYITAISA